MDRNDDACPAEHWLIPHIRAVQAETAQAGSRAKEADDGLSIDIFDPTQVRRKLPHGLGVEIGDGDFGFGPVSGQPASEYLAEWQMKLEEILADPRGPRRRLLLADDNLMDRLSNVRDQCPGFEIVTDLVMRAANLSAKTHSPLCLPAMLLVGPAGVGKTHFAKQLAAALRIHLEFIAGDLLSERGVVTGLSLTWRAARPGRVASALLDSSIASPLFVIDEVDKISAIHDRENPLAFLHTVLEPENAQKFCDEYLSFPMRADRCFWILTANETRMLSPPILDRLLVVPIKPPNRAAMMVIVRNIYKDANARYANWFEMEPSGEFLDALAHHNPRKASKIVEVAMGYAATGGRRMLAPHDITASVALLDLHEGARGRAGFVIK